MQNDTKPDANPDFEGILKAQAPKLTLSRRAEVPLPQLPIKKQVTANTLNDLDLDKELLDQYKAAKSVFEDIQYAEDIAPNQKAQVINTITTILQNIVKVQQDLHNVERMKLIENTLIATLQNHETLKEAFLKDYKIALEKLK
jgi:hypothetical protein